MTTGRWFPRYSWLAALLLAAPALADVPIPPAPKNYFNDYAGLVPADVARRLDDKLRQFEQGSSNQVVVAVFPELPSPSMEDFTVGTAQAWRVGQRKLDNGVVLFVFVRDRKMRIEVGYGLEGVLPDATARRILDDAIKPRFRAGDYAGGLAAGIDAIIAATRGEYRPPPGRTAHPISGEAPSLGTCFGLALALGVGWLLAYRARRGAFLPGGWGGWSSGGWSSGGGGWGGGGGFSGGGFSGGGGSFGGGGASGSW